MMMGVAVNQCHSVLIILVRTLHTQTQTQHSHTHVLLSTKKIKHLKNIKIFKTHNNKGVNTFDLERKLLNYTKLEKGRDERNLISGKDVTLHVYYCSIGLQA